MLLVLVAAVPPPPVFFHFNGLAQWKGRAFYQRSYFTFLGRLFFSAPLRRAARGEEQEPSAASASLGQPRRFFSLQPAGRRALVGPCSGPR